MEISNDNDTTTTTNKNYYYGDSNNDNDNNENSNKSNDKENIYTKKKKKEEKKKNHNEILSFFSYYGFLLAWNLQPMKPHHCVVECASLQKETMRMSIQFYNRHILNTHLKLHVGRYLICSWIP